MKSIVRFFKDEEGVTAIEYGMLAALIAVVILVAAATLGTNLSAIFTYISTELCTRTAAC